MVYNLQYIVLVKKFNNNFFSFIYNECFSRTLVEFNTNMNPYIQVFLAIVIVIILFVAALMVYNKETVAAIRETGKTKKVVPVFSGIVDFHEKSNFSYNTLDPNASNYLNMGNSVNQVSGAEYSYNFWLYIDNTDTNPKLFTTPQNKTQQIFADTGSTNIVAGASPTPITELPFVLFLRGSNRVVEYKSQCSSKRGKPDTETSANLYKTDVLVKSPLVKIENGGDALTVEFNTLDSPDGVKQGTRNTCNEIDTDWSFINQYRIGLEKLSSADFSQQWFMVTIVLQDTLPSDPYPLRNKIRARIYINGALKLDKYVVGQLGNDAVSPLKMNQGNIYINPKLTKLASDGTNQIDVSQTKDSTGSGINRAHKLMMADLTYYNYSLSADEVTSLFAAQFNKNPATTANISDSVTKKYLTVTENTNPNVKNIGATR